MYVPPAIRAATLTALLWLSGCATAEQVTKQNVKWLSGNTPELDPADVWNFRDRDKALTDAFEAIGRTTDDKSDAFVDAGIDYAHERCTKYLEAAFFFNRIRNTSSREIRYASAGTSALLALVKASRELAGILPLGFDFVDQTVNNIGQGLLYDLDPGVIMGLVKQSQDDFVANHITNTTFATHSAAMTAIREYTELCLPVAIEGQVNQQLASSIKTPRSGGRAAGPPSGANHATPTKHRSKLKDM